MRKLMWFTAGFGVACALWAYLAVGLWLAAICGALAVILFLVRERWATRIGLVLIGITVGFCLARGHDSLYLHNARVLDGKTTNLTVTVTDYSYETNFGVAADARLVLSGKQYQIRIYLPRDEKLLPGDQLKGEFRLRLTTVDSLQGQTYHQGDGIFLLAYADEKVQRIPGDPEALQFFTARVRSRVQTLLCDAFPADAAAFANALVLGQSNLLDYETDTDFKLSGIRHIIAVSGLHVAILMSVVYLFSGRHRYLSALIGIPVLLLFAAVVGFSPSVTRACIMQILMLVAMALNKEYDPPTALAFAALVMLAYNPMTIVSVSFQLSTGCLIGIFLFYERICGYLRRLLKLGKIKTRKDRILYGICSSVSITLSTTIATTPLSAAYFGTVSLVGILTNLLTLWILNYVFYLVIAVCAVGLIFPPAAAVLAAVTTIPIRYVILVAKVLGSLPYSAVYTCSSYIVVWIVMCYGLLAVFLLCKKKRPILLAGCAVLGLALALGAARLEPLTDRYRVTVFDVGQGQSILLECDSKSYLIDCGGDTDRMAADTVSHALLSRGKTRLDGIILTHYDTDHAGGVPLLLTGICADTLYLPDIPDEGDLRQTLSQSHNNIQWISQLSFLENEDHRLTFAPGEHKTRDNERSMCVLFQTENCDILITGDRSTVGEQALMKQLQLPQIEILIAGHHGSGSSTGMELLEKTKPKIAVISVKRDNFYGHPSNDVLYRLELFRCKVLRTDQQGTIVFRG